MGGILLTWFGILVPRGKSHCKSAKIFLFGVLMMVVEGTILHISPKSLIGVHLGGDCGHAPYSDS